LYAPALLFLPFFFSGFESLTGVSGKGQARLTAPDPDLEEGGRIWVEKDEVLIRMIRQENFHLEQLKRVCRIPGNIFL